MTTTPNGYAAQAGNPRVAPDYGSMIQPPLPYQQQSMLERRTSVPDAQPDYSASTAVPVPDDGIMNIHQFGDTQQPTHANDITAVGKRMMHTGQTFNQARRAHSQFKLQQQTGPVSLPTDLSAIQSAPA